MIRKLATIAAMTALWSCAAAQGDAKPMPAKPTAPPDTCGANAYQYLIGKPKSAIPHAPAGAKWRVTSSADAVTMDYVEARMNIVWDAKTQKVIKVRCG